MKKILIITGLLFSFMGLPGLATAFPTPDGFTTDRSKALELVVQIPAQTQRKVNFSSLSLAYFLCNNLKIKNFITTKKQGEQYTLAIMEPKTFTYSTQGYKTLCSFGWVKTKYLKGKMSSRTYLAKNSPEYYWLK